METAEDLLIRGEQLSSEGKWEEALSVYEKVVELEPENWLAYHHLGDCWFQKKDWEKASKFYESAISSNSIFHWSYCNLGRCLYNLGKIEEAVVNLQKAVEVEPKFSQAYSYLGDFLSKQEKWEEAITNYQKALELNPNLTGVKDKIEWASIRKDSIQNSIADLETADLEIPPAEASTGNVRLIAFFLPQYHPIPENDEWWGKGFTEWTNVTKAKPLFEGHYQPHLPADLGFYDLRVPEVREEQAKLARQYGVYGFCYYYYWFAGKRLLHRPVDEILESGKPDFPFCLCWANENWTRRWDGAEHDILIAQEHSEENNQAFAESLVPFLRDPRYIQINGQPLILVYRADILPEVWHTIEQWRNVFRKNGIGEVHLCAALTFNLSVDDLDQMGFDSGVEFPPHQVPPKLVDPVQLGISDHKGYIYNFEGVVTHSLSSPMPTKQKRFLTLMTGWDNTARKGKAANIFINSSPETYELWLYGAVEKTKQRYVGDERLIFVNAWNEWAEGTHLEPDRKYGHRYLSATARALNGSCDWKILLKLLDYLSDDRDEHFNNILRKLEEKVKNLCQSLNAKIDQSKVVKKRYLSVKALELKNQKVNPTHFDNPMTGTKVSISESSYLQVSGWSFNQEGNQVTGIRVLNGNHPVKDLLVDKERPDIYQAYQDLGFQNMKDEKMGFSGKVKAKDIFQQQEKEYIIPIYALVKGSDPIEIANLYINLIEEEKEKKIGRKLKSQIKWYNYTKSDFEQIFLDLREVSDQTYNFKETLDHLEELLNHCDALSNCLISFMDAEEQLLKISDTI